MIKVDSPKSGIPPISKIYLIIIKNHFKRTIMGNKPCCYSENTEACEFKINSQSVQVQVSPEEMEREFFDESTGFGIDFKKGLEGKHQDLPSSSEYSAKEKILNSEEDRESIGDSDIMPETESKIAITEIKFIKKGDLEQKKKVASAIPPTNLKKQQKQSKQYLDSSLLSSFERVNDASKLAIPKLNPLVKETYEKTKFFIVEDLKKQPLNWQKVPDGFFKFVKDDGSLYIGNFQGGQAHGRGVYIFSDGSYYEGMFRNDKADSYGSYFSENLVYKGEFRQNLFDGKGVEKGPDYIFTGLFQKGSKYHGTLEWTQNNEQYSFKGTFNKDSKFNGKGVLTEPTGVYEGGFKNGLKHGQAVYRFKNGYIYKGQYINNLREGKGRLLNDLKKIVFEGQFQNNLPIFSQKNKRANIIVLKYLGGDLQVPNC